MQKTLETPGKFFHAMVPAYLAHAVAQRTPGATAARPLQVLVTVRRQENTTKITSAGPSTATEPLLCTQS